MMLKYICFLRDYNQFLKCATIFEIHDIIGDIIEITKHSRTFIVRILFLKFLCELSNEEN